MDSVEIRNLQERDIEPIAAAFAAIGWDKPASQYQRYLADQEAGRRVVLVALVNEQFAGYLTVCWESGYPPFRESGYPEIQDFNVLPDRRRQGIGTRLMHEAERLIAQRAPIAGIGVGLYADYGAAQRLYVRLGYLPDGRGLVADDHFPAYGEAVRVDDDLVLYFTKVVNPDLIGSSPAVSSAADDL